MLWIKNLLYEVEMDQERYILRCDNQNANYLAKNSTFHFCTKHMNTRYHWIIKVFEEKRLHLDKVHADENWIDMMIKVISTKKFEDYCQGIGLVLSPY